MLPVFGLASTPKRLIPGEVVIPAFATPFVVKFQ
jgi:hypothetical protein